MYIVKLDGKESRRFKKASEALALASKLERVFKDLKVEVIKDDLEHLEKEQVNENN